MKSKRNLFSLVGSLLLSYVVIVAATPSLLFFGEPEPPKEA
ncbi:MAG: hypothetical protein PWQ12_1273 [Clostridiales bacterium]|jgi:cyclic lactone autoinducer peptide|nr:hypothetical protein [Clostridiales bacterium]